MKTASIFSAFETFSPESRVWVYQANREFTAQESELIQQAAQSFASNWEVHGTPAKAVAELLFGRFVIFAVDDSTPASGCSIDSSVRFMRELGEKYDIDFFDRMSMAYIHPETGKVLTEKLPALRDKLATGELPSFTVIFNNTITQLHLLNGQWMIEAIDSWLYKKNH